MDRVVWAIGMNVRLATQLDAARIQEIMLATGLGPGTGIDENLFKETMTVENVVSSMDRLIWLLWDGGLFLVIPISETTYEVHVSVLDGHRGADALAATETAIGMIFIRTPCVLLIGRTPLANRAGCLFALMSGFHRVRISGTSQIESLCFFDWLATREDPVYALSQCEEWGQSVKSAASRSTLEWVTRGEIKNKVEV